MCSGSWGELGHDQAILVKASVKGWILCHLSAAKEQGPQSGDPQRLQQVRYESMRLPHRRGEKELQEMQMDREVLCGSSQY